MTIAASGNQYRTDPRGGTPERPWALRFDGANGQAAVTVSGGGHERVARIAWSRDIGNSVARAGEILHPLERDYFDQVSSDRRRLSFLLGRHAAKQALAVAEPITRAAIIPGAMGQPVLNEGGSTEISISHDDQLACAVAAPTVTPIAVDLERAACNRAEIMRAQMSRREQGVGDRLGVDTKFWGTAFWTAKEALAKLLRCGHGCRFEVLEVAAMEISGASFDGRYRHFPQYRFVGWTPLPGYVVALALPRALTVEMGQAIAAGGRSRAAASIEHDATT